MNSSGINSDTVAAYFNTALVAGVEFGAELICSKCGSMHPNGTVTFLNGGKVYGVGSARCLECYTLLGADALHLERIICEGIALPVEGTMPPASRSLGLICRRCAERVGDVGLRIAKVAELERLRGIPVDLDMQHDADHIREKPEDVKT